MSRESNIPLFLWIATAALAHIAWGGGAQRVSDFIDQELDIHRFALTVEAMVRQQTSGIEVALVDEKTLPPPEEKVDDATDKSAPETDTPDKEDDSAKPDKSSKKPDKAKPKSKAEPEKKKPEPEKKKLVLPSVTPPKVAAEKKKAEPEKALPIPKANNRIAVKQHVDPDQKDNPEAKFIGNEANHVKTESQARITSTDQNDAKPTPGGNHSGPKSNPGDSDHNKIAQSEDRPGEQDRAPNDSAPKDTPKKVAMATPPATGRPENKPAPTSEPEHAARRGAASGSAKSSQTSTHPADQGQKAQTALAGRDATPETVDSPNGSFSVAQAQKAQKARKARKARRRHLPPPRGNGTGDWLGLGAAGTTKSGVNLNLTPRSAFAVVGKKALRDELRRDAERRRSAHLGSWKSSGIERWRSAIENYVPSVKPGNQTALNTARVPFANYLNDIHNRLHPIFADSFLASLEGLPDSNPMNRPDISTNLEIVVSQDDGHIVRMGVTKTSGVTAFDIGALESVQRASPFGAPPHEIISPDGNVYLHWEFYRNPYYACSTYFAHPFILKVAPQTAPPDATPPAKPPYDPKEPPAKDQRHGQRDRRGPALAKLALVR